MLPGGFLISPLFLGSFACHIRCVILSKHHHTWTKGEPHPSLGSMPHFKALDHIFLCLKRRLRGAGAGRDRKEPASIAPLTHIFIIIRGCAQHKPSPRKGICRLYCSHINKTRSVQPARFLGKTYVVQLAPLRVKLIQ